MLRRMGSIEGFLKNFHGKSEYNILLLLLSMSYEFRNSIKTPLFPQNLMLLKAVGGLFLDHTQHAEAGSMKNVLSLERPQIHGRA